MDDKIKWYGKSGNIYEFKIFDKSTEIPDVNGNYIFAKLAKKVSGQYEWRAIYIGEGNLKERTQDPEHLKCATSNGFTHYHVHANSNEQRRKQEEKDLIQQHSECLYINGGCNKTSDG